MNKEVLAKSSQFKASFNDSNRLQESVGLIKRQKSFQRLAIYGHEVLMSLQMREKFLGTYSTTSVTEPVIRDFNMT
jgi:hypothetical protein